MISLATESDATKFIRERVQSRLWWTIIGASVDGRSLANEIERRFYDGESSQFFDMVMIPATNDGMPLLSSMFFARKQEMTPSQLTDLMRSIGSASFEIKDPTQDVLLTPDVPYGFMEWFAQVLREPCED